MNPHRHLISAVIAVGFCLTLVFSATTLRSHLNTHLSHPSQAELVSYHDDDEKKTNSTDPPPAFEPLFVDWETPKVALFVSGRQHGYIEPCGCIGLDRQKGGMMRRHTLQKQLLEKGWSVVSVDAGNQVRRYGKQANIKLATTYECLCTTMNYQAVSFGPDDLRVPVIDLLQVMANYGGDNSPFVCANVTIFDPEFTNRFRIIESGGKKIGITAIVGDEHLEELPPSEDLIKKKVDESLAEVVPLIRENGCDLTVLIAQTSLEKSRQLAKEFPFFDVLITAGGAGEPTMFPEEIQSSNSTHVTRMIQVGIKGMYVGVIGLFDDDSKPLLYQKVPLDARFEDSEQIKSKFLNYQMQLQAMGLNELGLSPIRHPTGREFVGTEACADCHDLAYEIWKDGHDGSGGEIGPHSRATLDLTEPGERTWVKRHFDPECLSCHVTGWNPQKYFPYETGYLTHDDEKLHGSGCENCHGPGALHVAAENGDIDVDEETRVKYVNEMIVTLKQAKESLCMECHDLDNSPDFHKDGAFEKYWEKIKHYEDE